jgi:hypothetical protein
MVAPATRTALVAARLVLPVFDVRIKLARTNARGMVNAMLPVESAHAMLVGEEMTVALKSRKPIIKVALCLWAIGRTSTFPAAELILPTNRG